MAVRYRSGAQSGTDSGTRDGTVVPFQARRPWSALVGSSFPVRFTHAPMTANPAASPRARKAAPRLTLVPRVEA